MFVSHVSQDRAAVAAVSKSLRRGKNKNLLQARRSRSRRCFKEPEAVLDKNGIRGIKYAAVAAVSKSLRRMDRYYDLLNK